MAKFMSVSPTVCRASGSFFRRLLITKKKMKTRTADTHMYTTALVMEKSNGPTLGRVTMFCTFSS